MLNTDVTIFYPDKLLLSALRDAKLMVTLIQSINFPGMKNAEWRHLQRMM